MSGPVRFGAFEFDPGRRELRKHGIRIRVPDQSLHILAALIESPGETITRERIQNLLWPHGTVVGFEQSINAAVTRLREALGDPAENPRFIARVPRQGYCFIAPLERLPPQPGTSPAQASEGPPRVLLHYRLLEKTGSGAMGEVWKAEDLRLGRTVAVKLLPKRLADDDQALEALRQEARHAAALNHPNICTIHGLEEHDGQRFLVMEYIEGRPLADLLDVGPFPAEQIVAIGIQTADALAAAHAAGVIHRDVKAANLILTAGGNVKLTDFGIARSPAGREGALGNGGSHSLDGTLGYLSPEQARREPSDARSDLFSLGVVLYEMATGKRPFQGDTPATELEAVLEHQPIHPRRLNPSVPRDLERIILKALEKDSGARWQSASAMAAALRGIARRKMVRLLTSGVLAVAALIGITVLAAWSLWRRPVVPALSERDSIVIAEFDNKAGDAMFDGVLRQALLMQMGQSPYVSIVPEERITSTLGAMGRSHAEPLSRAVAREVCERTGAKAVLAGSIGKLAGRYFVGLEAIGCAGGEALASEYAEAGSRERVLTALTQVASKMRGRLGESLASVRKLSPPDEATTPSLEALRAYNFAIKERNAGRDGVPFLERAIQLDADFAAAHFMLAAVYSGRGQDAEAEREISKAYSLRERTSERERLAIEGLYHQIATGDAGQQLAHGRWPHGCIPGIQTRGAGRWSPPTNSVTSTRRCGWRSAR
jgi:eukaryotic-like serine/threonine-protein kinase